MHRKARWATPVVALSLFALPGCGSDDAEGVAVGFCTIVDLGDGTAAIRCPDGSELVVRDGKDGADGQKGEPGEKGDKGDPGEKGEDAACTLDEVDGTFVLTCGDASVVLGDACADGFPYGLAFGSTDGASTRNIVLFQATSCTWVRGDVEVQRGVEELPPALRRIEKIDGNFIVGTAGIEELSLPRLIEIGSGFTLDSPEGLVNVDLPSLTRVGGVYLSGAGDLERVSFASLATIDREIYIANNAKLSNLSFPLLETVGGWLQIFGGNQQLTTVAFPSLKQADGILVSAAKELESMSFPALETAGRMQLRETGIVTLDGFPSLTAVADWLTIDNNENLKEVKDFIALERVGYLNIYGNEVLESVADFPALEEINGGDGSDVIVYVANNLVLTSFGRLGSVSTIDGGVTFSRNAELPQADIDALLDGIEITGEVTLCGNKGGPAC